MSYQGKYYFLQPFTVKQHFAVITICLTTKQVIIFPSIITPKYVIARAIHQCKMFSIYFDTMTLCRFQKSLIYQENLREPTLFSRYILLSDEYPSFKVLFTSCCFQYLLHVNEMF